MVWFRVDDNLTFHQKALNAGNEAMGMWVRGGAHCAQHLTDGFIPADVVAAIGGIRLAKRLVSASLWVETEGGYLFHDWTERNPTRREVEEERKAAAERKARWLAKKNAATQAPGDADGTRSGTDDDTRSERVPNSVGNAAPTRAATRPDPTHTQLEEETPTESLPRKRATKIPEGWQPGPALIAWQRENGISDLLARREQPRFVDYWLGVAGEKGRKADWDATWRNWLRRAHDQEAPATRPTAAAEWWNN